MYQQEELSTATNGDEYNGVEHEWVADVVEEAGPADATEAEIVVEAQPVATFGTADTSRAAARLLEIAANNADQILGEAKSEAAAIAMTARADADQLSAASQTEATRITTSAQADSDQLLAAAHAEADQLLAAAQARSEQLLIAARAEADQAYAELRRTRSDKTSEIARLVELERDHRDRMHNHLTWMLNQITPETAD